MSITILVPVRNEEDNVIHLATNIEKEFKYEFELCFIDDFSTDNTFETVKNYIETNKSKKVKIIKNTSPGLGQAIKNGITVSEKKYVTIMMSDGSDDLDDLKKYYEAISQNESIDAVFGSRFIEGSKVYNYPIKKLILNRIFNRMVSIIFFSRFNDYTNAFKIYKKESLIKVMPIVSESFNVFLELPLKILVRKMSFKVIPISWTNRKIGKSKFVIKELGSKYLFTLLYCWLEKVLLKN